MLIRPERTEDAGAIRALTAAAFMDAPHSTRTAAGEPVEADLIDQLRADEGWIPALSLVACDDRGEIIGHVVCTRGFVGDTPALGLGPISVAPSHQRGGVGTALMRAVLSAAQESGERLVALLGDPAFYGRFGFEPARRLGIEAGDPAWGDAFQARVLSADCPPVSGCFRYAAPFGRL